MVSISGCAKADEADLVGQLTPVIGVGDEEDTVAELIEWPRLKGSVVEYPTGSSRFREFCKAKSSIDWIWGYAFAYRDNFFRTCSVSQGGDYLYLLPNLAKVKKCKRLGDEVSLEYVQGIVKDSRTDGFCWYLAQFDYGFTLPLSNLAKSVMNWIGACQTQLNCKFWEVILVCETLNGRWVASGSERRITAKDFLEYYVVKYVTTTDGAYLSYSSSRLCFFNLSSAGFKRVASKDDKVRRPQAKRRLAGKTPGSMEEKLSTPELNTPLKLARLNKILDGPVDVATVSAIVVRNMAKKKAIKRGAAPRSVTSVSMDDNSKKRMVTSPTKSQEVLEEGDKIAEGADLRPRFELEAGLLDKQCRAKSREKMVAVMDDEFKKVDGAGKQISQLEGEKNQLEVNLIRERGVFQLEREKEREAAALKLKEVRAKSEAEAERLVTASAISWNNLAGKLYQLRYTKAEIMAFSEGNYEEMEIMDEEEIEEREDGLNVPEKTAAINQETINQEIEISCLRVEVLEGLLEVEKKSSAELQKELDVVREREEHTLFYNVEYAEEYEVLFSQDLALNQLTNELAELKEKAASGFRHEAELAEYRIRALNKEISDMKCKIHTLNEQLLKREIELDTARTNLAVSEADFEKLSSSIMGKYRELCNSAYIRDSLIARLDRVKANLRRLKGREAQSRADLAEI
ncbi:hypothetical protein GIB67_013631 [Kingdonia uniflora]|uniref:Uncharacterized protein n=1 Tax=Kingdonia uniflora TaxID=39325 RepID=A0A7J7NPT3_9MAGN|nr:hypothetical protein GIB67_013631 [Kingdonia uniflora]